MFALLEVQRIRFEPIYDADSSVFFDLDAKKQDKSDAKYCFVLYSMTRDAYRAEWNDDPSTWPKEIHQYEYDWDTPDVVYVAEFYRVEEVRETIRIFATIDGEEERYTQADFDADETLEETLMAVGTVLAAEVHIGNFGEIKAGCRGLDPFRPCQRVGNGHPHVRCPQLTQH